VNSGSYPLYDFLKREYHPVWGRWVSPDPAGLGAVNPANPQSWNRYAYVTNNPLALTDPTGLQGNNAINDVCQWHPQSYLSPCDKQNYWGGYPGRGDLEYMQIWSAGEEGGWTDFLDLASWLGKPTLYARNWWSNFGIRARGQTWNQCMVQNVANYSAGGALDLVAGTSIGTSTAGQVLAGNTFTGLYSAIAGSPEDAATGALTSSPDLLNSAMGSTLTFGRRTSGIMALNLAGKGGLPQALSSSTGGLKSLLGTASKALNLGLDASVKAAIDAGAFGAEIVGCSIQW